MASCVQSTCQHIAFRLPVRGSSRCGLDRRKLLHVCLPFLVGVGPCLSEGFLQASDLHHSQGGLLRLACREKACMEEAKEVTISEKDTPDMPGANAQQAA